MAPLGDLLNIPSLLLLFAFSLPISVPPRAFANNSKLFREYIGAGSTRVDFSDVPVNPDVDFHFILAFAIDYTVADVASAPPTPADGAFAAFWDTDTLTPYKITSLKRSHPNVKLALSLGGDSFGDNRPVYFKPSSVNSWVANAVSSLTRIIESYDVDGIDIDYEHFLADPDTFAECIGRLVTVLKTNKVISFASIAPFEDREVKVHYRALWKEYGHAIDYVNFQFYAYDSSTTNATRFAGYFEEQSMNYYGGNVLVALSTDKSSSGGLLPQNGFFDACNELKMQNKLHGIFIWAADYSISNGFYYEIMAQKLLASA